jgi:hypothetical protein
MLESFFLQPITKFFTTDSNRSYKFFFTLLITFITSLSLILVSTGSAPIVLKPWDVIIQLDGGWRIINEQTPHIDFYSPLGPLSLLLTAFGMKVASPSASSIVYGSVLLFLVLTPWAWFIARSRLSSANAFLFALFMGFFLVTPRALGDGIRELSYATLYNRQGFVLLSLLLIELFIPYRPSVRHKNYLLSGLSSGILLGLLLFCKINYFGVGAVAVLIRILIFRFQRTWLIAFTSGFLLICITMQIFFKVNLFSLISNVALAAKAQSFSNRLQHFLDVFQDNSCYFCLTLTIVIFLSIGDFEKEKQEKNKVFHLRLDRTLILTAFVALSGLLICSTNGQWKDIPLFFVAGLIPLEYLRREVQFYDLSFKTVSGIKYFWCLLIVISFCGNILGKDLASFGYSVYLNSFKVSSISETQRFQSKTLHDLVVPEWSRVGLERNYIKQINDGLALLRQHVSSNSRVFALDFSNPFPFALELPPPHGDALWWHSHVTFNRNSFPKAEQTFKDVDMVMTPKNRRWWWFDETEKMMEDAYGNYLSKYFIEKDKSQFWTLLLRAD